MSRYTIKDDILDRVMRQSIDMAVHNAVSRFREELGDQEQLVYRIATAAADTAVEQFKTWCNAELRLIEAEHENRLTMLRLRPPTLVTE